jgi:hypothetical protein
MKKWVFTAMALSSLMQCSRPTALSGGSTITDNAKVSGSVFYINGLPAKSAAVRMRTHTYVQPVGTKPDSLTRYDTVTDDSGRFSIDSVKKGEYRIEINDEKTSAVLIPCIVKTTHDSITLGTDTLRRYSTISGKVDSLNTKNGQAFVQVVGLERLVPVDSTGLFIIPDLPASTYQIKILSLDTAIKPLVVDSVKTAPDSVTHVIDTVKTAPPDTSSPVVGQWVPTNGPYASTVKCIAVSLSGDVYAGTDGGGVFRSIDNGATWTAIDSGLSQNTDKRIQFLAVSSDGNNVYAGTQSGIFHSANHGSSWTSINNGLDTVHAFYFHKFSAIAVSPNKAAIFAAVELPGLYVSTDNGATWSVINSGTGISDSAFFQCLAVCPDNARGGMVFAGTLTDGIYRSMDNGVSWTQVNNGLTDLNIPCLTVSPDRKKIFIVSGPGIYVSADSGTNWTSIGTTPLNYAINAIAVAQNNSGTANIVVSSYGIGIFLSADNGGNWSQQNGGWTNLFVNALAANGTTVFAGFEKDGMFTCDINGATWTPSNNGITNVDIYSFVTSGASLFTGTSLGVFRSNDNGVNWTQVNNGLNYNFGIKSLASISNGTGTTTLLASNSSPIDPAFISNDNGASWTSIKTPDSNCFVNTFAVIGSTIFAGIFYSGSSITYPFIKSVDYGVTWTPTGAGLSNPLGVANIVSATNGAGGVNVFAGTVSTGIFLSKDNCANWTPVNTGLTDQALSDIFALAAGSDGAHGATVLAGTEDGIYLSVDNGAHWALSNTGMPQNPRPLTLLANPNGSGGTMFFAGTGGNPVSDGVFFSRDNGVTWTAINSGLPNAWVYALIVKDKYLFAGLEGIGVWKLRLK